MSENFHPWIFHFRHVIAQLFLHATECSLIPFDRAKRALQNLVSQTITMTHLRGRKGWILRVTGTYHHIHKSVFRPRWPWQRENTKKTFMSFDSRFNSASNGISASFLLGSTREKIDSQYSPLESFFAFFIDFSTLVFLYFHSISRHTLYFLHESHITFGRAWIALKT